MDTQTQNPPEGEFFHTFRPGLFRAARACWLDGDALFWRIGGAMGQTALSDVASLRLHLSPAGETRPSMLVLTETSGRRHKISDYHRPGWRLKTIERRAATFACLACALSRRVKRANPQARMLAGPGWPEWIGSWFVALLVVAVTVGGLGTMIAHGAVSFPALAFMGVAILQLPLLWPILRSGGPKPFDPDRLFADRTASKG